MKRASRLKGWLCAGGLVWACSVQVPDEEELFANAGRGGSAASGGSAGTSGAAGSSGSGGADASGDGASGDSALAEAGDGPDAAGPFQPNVGLLIHYTFDESSGDIVHDQNSSDNNARAIGTVTWLTTGKIGGALQLPGGTMSDAGVTPPYVELPRNVLLPLSATTIAIWFRWEGGSNPQHVFDLGSGLPSWVYFSPLFAGGPRVGVHKIGQPDDYFDVFVSGNVEVGRWTHVAITWDAGSLDVYLDGAPVGRISPPEAPVTEALILPKDLGNTTKNWIGRSQFTPPEAFNDPFFAGTVDEFRIYDRVLPAAHVAALHALGE
ncbi:MAG TPA: LamG domain-containing protein [Polyangiaceae bacterium]